MKKFLMLLFVTLPALGAITDAHKRILNKSLGVAGNKTQIGTLIDEGADTGTVKDGHQPKQVAIATYDYAVDGGSSTAHNLGVTLPAGALIVRSYVNVITSLSGGSIAIGLVSSGDVKAATASASMTSGLKEGIQTGTMSNALLLGSAAPVVATITGANGLTAGKLKVFLEYVMAQ